MLGHLSRGPKDDLPVGGGRFGHLGERNGEVVWTMRCHLAPGIEAMFRHAGTSSRGVATERDALAR